MDRKQITVINCVGNPVGLQNNDDYDVTAPVGSYDLASGVSCVGAFDMSGNVYEWTGSQSNSNYIFKGGSFGDAASNLGSAFRNYGYPTNVDTFIGFRCILDS